MLKRLGALSRIVATPVRVATPETVVAACACICELLDAEDVYVIRSGDPAYIRMGSSDEPSNYEIKQRGYWLAWREAAAQSKNPLRALVVKDRVVEEVLPLEPGVRATHIATILPGDESNSELLIIRGPWPAGVSEEVTELVNTIRPMMAFLVANVLDGERHERMRSQMRVLADVAGAFSEGDETQSSLGALATALARASAFAWVQILLFDPGIDQVVDRALNLSRHSNTETARQAQQGRQSENSGARDIRVARHLAWTRQPYLVPDISDPSEQFLVNDELRPYYERAHVFSMAVFPVFVQDQLLGTITFSASEQQSFEKREVEFLWSLVAQAGPTIKAFRLNRELREAEQRLRAVFSNAPAFITVIEPDGSIVLSEGAGLLNIGQAFGALVGASVYDTVPEARREALFENIQRALKGENFEVNAHLNKRHLQTRYSALKDETGEASAVICVTLDVTDQFEAQTALQELNGELQLAKERAEYLVSHDALTGILSRRAWFEAAEVAATAIAVFDVDNFKSINDRFGHPAGDRVLQAVAERMAAAIQGDGVIGRLGGEEFGVFFTVPIAEAEVLCRRAVELVAAMPCVLRGGAILTVTVSAGLAPYSQGSDEPLEALQSAYAVADQALYLAKAAGRHQLVVSEQAA